MPCSEPWSPECEIVGSMERTPEKRVAGTKMATGVWKMAGGRDVQSNQKMHDLYATLHIFLMDLPDAFWAV